ncbi:cyclase family protein [Pseudomonas sp. Z1-14]|uniref:cyclase family protein n=1 Tax=Pseudomonas sp. Z1-14 TaxID=2817409 RepID=UPI003DA82B3F
MSSYHKTLPTYDQLMLRQDAPPGSSWGLFGENDQIGTLNLIDADSRLRGVAAAIQGKAFSLDLPSTAIYPSLAPTRKPIAHHIFQRNDFHHDEWLDNFYTQYGSQIDGLRHIGHPQYGFYNGYDHSQFKPGTETLSIHHFAALPIATRGVLIDVQRYMAKQGMPLDQSTGQAISIDTIEAARLSQNVEILPGDAVVLRFGWLNYYLNQTNIATRDKLVTEQFHPGLEQSNKALSWLWDNRISLIAADNFALECWPAKSDSPFFTPGEMSQKECSVHAGIMHRAIIPLLGMPIGELWAIDKLAEACAEDNRYTFLLTASPLPIVGGVGSPANAIAIR